MSVRINYRGNIGNCLFQYVYGRMFAEQKQLQLQTPFPYQKLLRTTPHKADKLHISPQIVLTEPLIRKKAGSDTPDENDIKKRFEFYHQLEELTKPAQYILSGYFECSDLFNNNEQLIKSYFKLDDFKKNTEDVVMNVRLGDFANIGRIINSDWYLQILEQERFNRLYIVGADKDEPYLKAFDKYNPIIVPGNPVNDFHFIRSFDKIICSNSTYCWWAAFFSEASTIYIADKWLSPLITSCKSSVCIEADYLSYYKGHFFYQSTLDLLAPEDKLKVQLDSFITPDAYYIKLFFKSSIDIIYDNVRKYENTEPQKIQISMEGIGSFCINLYENGTWLSEGVIPLPDCEIIFADWKGFHQWLFNQLKTDDIPFMKIKGLSVLVQYFDWQQNKKQLNYIYNELIRDAGFINYIEMKDPLQKAAMKLQEGEFITVFCRKDTDQGNLYICTANDFNFLHTSKFYFLKEVLPEEQPYELKKITGRVLTVRFFKVQIIASSLSGISIEQAFQLFNFMQVQYMVLDQYFIYKN